jgi:hypothetical protein
MTEEALAPTPAPAPPERFCSFCGKSEKHVSVLLAGPHNQCGGSFICDECVHLCSIIIGRKFIELSKRAEDDAAYIEAGQKLLQPNRNGLEGDPTQ